jgi:Uma2 family endonuclease
LRTKTAIRLCGSPSTKHEKYKTLINEFVLTVCYELDMEVVSLGSFTMKLDALHKGAEADDCFYIQHAGVVLGKDNLDLNLDPPPDLVIEIDLASDSRNKFEIYASLGVPEIWRYDGRRLSVLQLIDGHYLDVGVSLCLPFFGAETLSELIATLAPGTNQARRALREWIRANRPPTTGSK